MTHPHAALIEAAEALRKDMLERAELRIDTINGEQYQIVNAGNGAWVGFCAALFAAQSATPEAAPVRVKPLVWTIDPHHEDTEWADGIGGQYQINRLESGLWLLGYPNGDTSAVDAEKDVAEAAAQAHHDETVRGMLE